MQASLVAEGHQVQCFHEGKQGFAAMKESPPDLVLADVALPEMNGLDIAVEVRRDIALRDTPIIVMMSLDNTINRIDGLKAADDYISKPIKQGELIAKVHALLRRSTLTGGLKGKLEMIGGAGPAIQMALFSHTQGALIFDDGTVLYFVNSMIVHVVHPALKAEAAVKQVLTRQSGTFRFEPQALPPEQTMNIKPEALLLELTRQLDEEAHYATLEPIDIEDPSLTIVPNLVIASTFIETAGRGSFEVYERFDAHSNKPCLVFSSADVTLVVLRCNKGDIPHDMQSFLRA